MPKLKYEKKIQNIMTNTKMDKQASIQARTKFIQSKDKSDKTAEEQKIESEKSFI